MFMMLLVILLDCVVQVVSESHAVEIGDDVEGIDTGYPKILTFKETCQNI